MKTRLILTNATAMVLMALSLNAQQVSKDSIDMLKNQQEQIEAGKKLNESKIKLAKLENELAEKSADAEKKAGEAQKSADENKVAAENLRNDPQNKKLSGQAAKAARTAERNVKAARKATDQTDDLKKEIESMRTDIAKEESALATANLQGSQGTLRQAAAQPQAQPEPATTITTPQTASETVPPPATPNVTGAPTSQNPQPITISNGQVVPTTPDMGQKVIESTYRSYPQQPGQPTIIINNIVSPGYDKNVNAAGNPGNGMAGMSPQDKQDRQEFEDFKAWKRQSQMRGNERGNGDKPARLSESYMEDREQYRQQNEPASSEHMTFRQRFGEKPARNSGLWVIPMVGVHASNFKTDIGAGEADGRIGWNAGLDFRIHMKRFFIQPGAHYFSSSMQVTSEDSVADAPLLNGPRIHSLKVPVLLGLYLTKAHKGFFKMNVKGGVTGTYVIAVDKSDLDQFSKDNIEDYSYGLNAGLGLEFGLITLDFSHEWGMSALFKDNSIKNNVLRATVGLKL